MKRCKHASTHLQAGKNGGEYVVCSACTVVVRIIRIGPEKSAERGAK